MNEILMYLVTVPVGVLFVAFVLGGGLVLPIWEYLDSRDPGRRTRDPATEADVIELPRPEDARERVAA